MSYNIHGRRIERQKIDQAKAAELEAAFNALKAEQKRALSGYKKPTHSAKPYLDDAGPVTPVDTSTLRGAPAKAARGTVRATSGQAGQELTTRLIETFTGRTCTGRLGDSKVRRDSLDSTTVTAPTGSSSYGSPSSRDTFKSDTTVATATSFYMAERFEKSQGYKPKAPTK